MTNEPTLFDIDQYDITPKLKALESLVRPLPTFHFGVDKLQKMSTMYGVSCETVLRAKERVTNEQLSDDSED
jgi:hypothetical protein